MSDGSGSHCKMMSESPRQFNMFTLHVTANVSVDFRLNNCGLAVSNRCLIHAQHFQYIGSCSIFQNKVVILNNGIFALVRSIRLCGSVCGLPLAHDVHHGWNGRCVNSCYILILKRFTQESVLHLLRQKLCRLQLDPQQLVARPRRCAWTYSASPTQHTFFCEF